MPWTIVGVGKGVSEPCSPNRKFTAFGADFGVALPLDWNCPPQLVSPATTFDLSSITLHHETVIALATGSGLLSGTYTADMSLYRVRDNKFLVSQSLSRTIPSNGWGYFGLIVGWLDGEIGENGRYRIEFHITGPVPFDGSTVFDITGIPLPPELPEVIAEGITGLIRSLELVSSWCYSIYTTVLGWIWPFWLAAEPFYWLSLLFMKAATATAELSTWLTASFDAIWKIIDVTQYLWVLEVLLPTLSAIFTWFADWVTPILSTIVSWWETVQETVKGWISAAVVGLGDLLADWGTFVTDVLPNLLNLDALTSWWDDRLADIQSLITTAFTARESLWAGWDTMRDKVVAFFTSPLDFLWGLFTDWFLGPEEA